MKLTHVSRALRPTALGAGLLSLAAAAVLMNAGTASAYTDKVYGEYSSSFSCNAERSLNVAANNQDDGGRFYYGPCIQAPDSSLLQWGTKPGKWYFTLQRR